MDNYPIEIRKLVEAERASLGEYLARNQSTLTAMSDQFGQGTLDNLLLGLAVMQRHINEAVTHAHSGDARAAGYTLGTGAKRTKDDIYVVMMEALGGPTALLSEDFASETRLLRDYVMSRYDGGVRQVELVLSIR